MRSTGRASGRRGGVAQPIGPVEALVEGIRDSFSGPTRSGKKVSTESRDFQSLHCHLPLHAHANLSGIGAISRFTIALRCLLRSAVVQRRGPDCQSQADAREKMMGPDGGERQAANATRDASRGVAATYDGSIVDPFPMYAQYRRGEPVIEDWASARESTPASAGRRPGSKSN
jgi:hypothetical protein